MIFKSEGEIDPEIIELKDGDFTISVDVDADVDSEGNQVVTIHKKVEKIVIELMDIEDQTEIAEIPGVHLNTGNQLNLKEVDYYPNPNEGEFTLRFKGKSAPTQIRIIDMMGKEVYNENINDFGGIYDKKINLSGNDAGVYVLQVIQSDKSWSKKLVVE